MANALIGLDGSPGAGFVRCALVTLPPNTVAHELNDPIKTNAVMAMSSVFFHLKAFFDLDISLDS